MSLNIHLLGPPAVLREETPLSLPGNRPLALLAYLLVTGKAHTRTHLTDLLFTTSADPRAGLRWTLTKLRKTIGPEYILANREQVAFNDEAIYSCDVDGLLAGDVDVYRGDFLEGFFVGQAPLFEEWQLITAQQLRQRYQDELLSRIAQHEMRGEAREIVSLAARLVQMDGLREEWRRTLMRAYAALGEWDAAGKQYEQCRQLLHTELSTTPSQETVALWQRIERRQLRTSSADSIPEPGEDANEALPTADDFGRPANLPFFRTSFVGRADELRQIQSSLLEPDCRLLTVVGPGGIGKTRLAVQAALNLERHFEQGIYFVPLRQVVAADAIAAAIARSLGLTFYSGEGLRVQLLTYLRRKSILLLLDNMEHLLITDWHTGEELLTEILTYAPNVSILATSRERLHMPEEWLCTLAGVDFPANGEKSPTNLLAYPAVQLFLQRARQVDPAYHPERVRIDDLNSIVTISQRTAGMPLALEMAAAWVRQLPCREIADSLVANVALLTAPTTQGPARHASMNAVFTHSWSLLDADLQRLLAQLSVFRARFGRKAAATVTNGSIFALSTLLDKSLLQTTSDGRYQLHELLRQFAEEKLADDQALDRRTRTRHSVYYLDLCKKLGHDLKGGSQVEAAAQLEEALGNVQLAFAWAIDQGDWSRVADASFGLGHFCWRHGRVNEGHATFTRVVSAAELTEATPAQTLAQARAYYWLGQLAEDSAATPYWQQASSRFQQARSQGLGTDFDEAIIEEALAWTYEMMGNSDQAAHHSQASLAAARRSGDLWAEAQAYLCCADLQVWILREYHRAAMNAQAALSRQRALGDRIGMVETLGELCIIETFMRHYEQAIRLSEEALAISQMLGNDLQTAAAHHRVSWSLLLAGCFDACVTHLHRAYTIYDHYGQDSSLMSVLMGLAWRNCMGGHYDEARRYADELQMMLAEKNGHLPIRGCNLFTLSQLAFLDQRYQAALEFARESREILAQFGSHNQFGLALIALGFANLAHGRVEQASEQAQELLSLGTTIALCGLGIVALVMVKGKPDEATVMRFYELLALQRQATPMCDSPFYRACIARLQPPEVGTLSSSQRELAETRGRALDPDAVIGEFVRSGIRL